MMKRILFLLGLLLALPAGATQPWKHPGPLGMRTTSSIDPPDTVEWRPTDGTASPILYSSGPLSCTWNGDTTSSSGGTVTLTIYGCTENTGTTPANDCNVNQFGQDAVIPGGTSSSFQWPRGYLYVVPNGSAANGVLHCETQAFPNR